MKQSKSTSKEKNGPRSKQEKVQMVDISPLPNKEEIKETKKEGDSLKNQQTPKNYPNRLTDVQKAAIQDKVDKMEDNKKNIEAREHRKKYRVQLREQQDKLSHKLYKLFTCQCFCSQKYKNILDYQEEKRNRIFQEKNGKNPELLEHVKKDYYMKQLMKKPSEEEEKINQAKAQWKKLRSQKKMIRMMSFFGSEKIKQLKTNRDKMINKDNVEQSEPFGISLIIPSESEWNMWWNNFTVVFFVIYIILTPLLISGNNMISKSDQAILLIFDIVFMLDRVLDLFVGFKKQDGSEENEIGTVIYQNLSPKFFVEIIIGFGPQIFLMSQDGNINSLFYGLFKLPRYTRLFEMDGQIQEIIEFYKEKKTVFEIKRMQYWLDVTKFAFQTGINLHFLTCMQIIMCIHTDYENSWMGGAQKVSADDFTSQYIIAIYFVTTTVSTCGFGDIYPTKGNPVEIGCTIFLQFVGMLFYSMTIQKFQSFMISDEISPGEYANFMVEMVENLIVKVGRQLPPTKRIPGNVINEWKIYTLKYFQLSPNAFLTDNEFYQNLSSNMKVNIVKNYLEEEFQKKFQIIFIDKEFGFSADDKLITQVIASLQYEHFDFKKENDAKKELDQQQSIIPIDQVSTGIYFIHEGSVDFYYKTNASPLLRFDEGSYFGDISFIFQIKNQYKYLIKHNTKPQFYSLQEKYLQDIFKNFPQFQQILQIRALRRQHYFKRLKNQQNYLMRLRDGQDLQKKQLNNEQLTDMLLKFKKVRLVEDKMSYEDLVIQDNFSDDEVTFDLNRQLLKDRKNKIALRKAKKMQQQLSDLKKESYNAMKAIIETVVSIDESSQKMVFKNFNQTQVNILAKQAPNIIFNLQKISSFSQEKDQYLDICSDQYQSDSSGCESKDDEVNKIVQYQKRIKKQEYDKQSNHKDSQIDDDLDDVDNFNLDNKRDVNDLRSEVYKVGDQIKFVDKVNESFNQSLNQKNINSSSLQNEGGEDYYNRDFNSDIVFNQQASS